MEPIIVKTQKSEFLLNAIENGIKVYKIPDKSNLYEFTIVLDQSPPLHPRKSRKAFKNLRKLRTLSTPVTRGELVKFCENIF